MHVLDESEDIQQAYSSGRDIYSITHHTHRSTSPPCDDGRAADDEDDDDTHTSRLQTKPAAAGRRHHDGMSAMAWPGARARGHLRSSPTYTESLIHIAELKIKGTRVLISAAVKNR